MNTLKNTISSTPSLAAILAIGATTLPASAQARLVQVTGLTGAEALGVSGDGKVVVGISDASPNAAFRWTELTGMVAIVPGGPTRAAVAASADGSIIAGDCRTPDGGEATRWSGGAFARLGELPGGSYYSRAQDMSDDGSVIVGHSISDVAWEAFRWDENEGMIALGSLPTDDRDSRAYGVSGDGRVVVGYSNHSSNREAFRWTVGEGMVGLGELPGGQVTSTAFAANRDGSVIVGSSDSAASGFNSEAFRWTQDGGMVGLGDFPGGAYSSGAAAVNADGSVVVGYSSSAQGRGAMVWTADLGMVPVWDLLLASGFDPAAENWDFLLEANAVSDNGSVIVGVGSRWGNRTSFMAVLPELSTACYADFDKDGSLTIFDFLAFQNAFYAGDFIADCDEDGELTIFDFLCFQNAFDAGCE